MSVPLYEQLYRHILHEIRQGRLKGGDQVPSEKELAEQFSVSRITSKKALEKLHQVRVIDRVRGRGSFVATTLPELSAIEGELTGAAQASNGAAPAATSLGLIMPDFSDSFGAQLLRAIEACAAQADLRVVLKLTYGRREEEERAIRDLVRFGVDGLIIFPVHGEYYNADLLRLVLDGFPVVLVDRYLRGIAAHAVYTDNVQAAIDLTSYLLERGHSHVAFLSPPAEHTSTIEDRLQGFTAACANHGLRVPSEYLLTNLFSTMPVTVPHQPWAADQATLRRFLDEQPQVTAFVACEYNIALLLHDVLHQHDPLRAEQAEIVCFDSVAGPFVEPAFTHIQQDEAAMGRTAVNQLLALLRGEAAPVQTVVAHRLVERAVVVTT
ncbi:MAG: GntR family transcriptional regulator [Chloroflexaceae bacterium]|nr:GntR family transcriptional regulator [Chloroflexaceae bacterium]